MEVEGFERTFEQICTLNDTEGPSRNVLEPKFDARTQFEQLETALNFLLANDAKDHQLTRLQLARISTVLIQNHIDTDEYAEAEKRAVKSYQLVVHAITGVDPTATLTNIDDVVAHDKTFIERVGFAHVGVFLRVLNAVGIYLTGRTSSQRMADALKVLHEAEAIFNAYAAHSTLPDPIAAGTPTPTSSSGAPEQAAASAGTSSPPSTTNVWLSDPVRKELLELHTGTNFYLAQCYGANSDVERSSKYCHWTMSMQLICQKEYSPKEWARNAVHLSGFFNTVGLFDESLHCMDAARHVMPKENPDEDTSGVVAWGYGKLHKARLRWFVEQRHLNQPTADIVKVAQWWRRFPISQLETRERLPVVDSFDSARACFKLGLAELQEALKWYVFDGCCTDHIEIQRDVAALYDLLSKWEPILERRIAMHGRRLDLLRPFPEQLNFNAYGTLVRQLLFDCGDIAAEIVDARIEQRKAKSPGALTDAQFNEFSASARGFFEKFVKTFCEKGPLDQVEEENRVPVFRALMRIASLQSKQFHRTPKAEYDAIGVVIEKYQECVNFARRNRLDLSADVASEVALANEMLTLLPGKQKQIWRAFN